VNDYVPWTKMSQHKRHRLHLRIEKEMAAMRERFKLSDDDLKWIRHKYGEAHEIQAQ